MAQFELGQRVATPFGAGYIAALPYNNESDRYIVGLDKATMMPLTKDKSILSDTLVAEAKYIKPE
jgi:hypothetical protein